MVGCRVKLLPVDVNKWGLDSNSGQFVRRRTVILQAIKCLLAQTQSFI